MLRFLFRLLIPVVMVSAFSLPAFAGCKTSLPAPQWRKSGSSSYTCKDEACGKGAKIAVKFFRKGSYEGAGYAAAVADLGKPISSPIAGKKGMRNQFTRSGKVNVIEVYSEPNKNAVLGTVIVLQSIADTAKHAAANLSLAKNGLNCQ